MAGSGPAGALVPAALGLLMLGLGLSLRISDFGRVLRTPKALAAGLGGQLVLLPALGLLVVRISGLESSFALGLLVLTLSPGGALSNVVCGLIGADVPAWAPESGSWSGPSAFCPSRSFWPSSESSPYRTRAHCEQVSARWGARSSPSTWVPRCSASVLHGQPDCRLPLR